jgi:hypothetical protein
MLARTTRAMTAAERKVCSQGLPIFALRARMDARREVRDGAVEVLTFEVARAWPLISCLGEGCCPYTWLLDVGDCFVYARSWKWLGFSGQDFPGQRVTIERFPLTKRVLGARAEGPPVAPLPQLEEAWRVFDEPTVECDVIERAAVRLPASPT